MAYGRTLHEIMSEPARPARRTILKTLGEIMTGEPDHPADEDGEIPTTEGPLREKLAAWDAEIGRIKNELFARKLSVKPPGEAALAASHEKDLNRHLGRMMVVRDEIAGRLQRCLQARVVEDMHADDGEVHAVAGELQKLYARRAAIIEKREAVSDQERRDLGREIDRLEDIIRR